jgi:hypothetical protein
MKNKINTSFLLILAAILFMACDKQQSVQEYYVEKQDNGNFIAIDLPASIIKLSENASEETKETLGSIKKLNILAFQINDENEADYETEYANIKEILKGDQYNELMRMKHENFNIVINYQGEDDAVDEFLLFASDRKQGFALARILGDNMQPAKIMKLANDMKGLDEDGEGLSELTNLFKGLDIN